MHTRSGLRYPHIVPTVAPSPLKRSSGHGIMSFPRKRARSLFHSMDFMDGLPDDLVLLILSKLSSTANAPSDLIN
ncbi:hypothetical protein HPP92_021053, partial [Vanilla planifolia]